MAKIHWDASASLMRVIAFDTADSSEELIGRGTLQELVSSVLDFDPAEQRGLLIRTVGADWTQEFDTDAIRELAARPGLTSAFGKFEGETQR